MRMFIGKVDGMLSAKSDMQSLSDKHLHAVRIPAWTVCGRCVLCLALSAPNRDIRHCFFDAVKKGR